MSYDSATWTAGKCPVPGHERTLLDLDQVCLLCRADQLHRSVAMLIDLVKPACRLCGRPATQHDPPKVPGAGDYVCDLHAGARAKDLPGAAAIREAKLLEKIRSTRKPASEAPDAP